MWAFALTFAATSSSGGSFTGFPSMIYSHGWILALWIGSYMVVPICMIGILGKRINQVARLSNAITVPDVFRDRFNSAHFGLLATGLLVFFMSFNLVAQFKAGSLILKTLLEGVDYFHGIALWLDRSTEGIAFLKSVEPEYLLCLLAFGIVVILYTTYGGFHAVVWTDVMQGFVMVCGVLFMLPLALYQVGGLEQATRQLAQMRPPELGVATLRIPHVLPDDYVVPSGIWLAFREEQKKGHRLFRVNGTTVIPAGETHVDGVDVLEVKSKQEIRDILADVKSIVSRSTVAIENPSTTGYRYGAKDEQKGAYVTGPGPSRSRSEGFLPLSLAFSFFFMWAIAGTGQPSNYVRLMAFRNTKTMRLSICTVAIYYSLIYFPLVVIFCCARVIMPGMEAESDRIMPAMIIHLTKEIGAGWLGGLLVAAPFAAVMSTVDSFLLMISSSVVRDVYQRNINPGVTNARIKRMCYLSTLMIGIGAMLGAVNPPQFLQDIIVYTGSGLAACFLGPMVFALYWPRANTAGCSAGMAAGFLAHLSLYVAGWIWNESFFEPYRVFNLDPIILGLVVSFLTVYVVTLWTPAPSKELVRRYFYKREAVKRET